MFSRLLIATIPASATQLFGRRLHKEFNHRILKIISTPTIVQVPRVKFFSKRNNKDAFNHGIFGAPEPRGSAKKLAAKDDLKDMLKGHTPLIQLQIVEAYRRGVQSNTNAQKKTSTLQHIAVLVIRMITIGLGATLLLYLIRSPDRGLGGGLSKIFDSTVASFADNVDVRFSDVRGCDEVKKELEDIVEFLRNPEKFSKLGAKLPKGVLLVGPPGVGKTLLARAVAGEAQVPFLYVSGSNFEEMFVGMGASRVRQLFAAAKEHAPCLIFIDEIDSVGRFRSSSPLHPYANQTINQLLAEMDGFEPSEGIIVLGATNQRDDLDKALLRPGRFDFQVYVSPPSFEGRVALFQLYLSKVRAASEVDAEKLALGTVGYTGADIQNLVNQAAITAGLKEEPEVTMAHLWDARDRLLMGPAKTRPLDEESNKVSAFHEAGHALMTLYTNDSVPLHKVTIIPRGESGGHTSFLQDKDSNFWTRSQLIAQLDVLMGGRVGEEMAFGLDHVTTGAGDDFKKATAIAENMVSRFGLSKKLGPRVFVNSHRDGNPLSQATRDAIDNEVDDLLNESLARAREVLTKHHKEHQLLAEALLFYETLNSDQVRDILSGKMKVPKGPRPIRPGSAPSPKAPLIPSSQTGVGARKNNFNECTDSQV